MKKITSLILVLMLALACVSFSAAEDFTGTWYMTEMSAEGITVSPADLGMEATLVMNEDGTAVLDLLGQVIDVTWAEENGTVTLTAEGESLPLVYDGAALSMDMDGVGMKFERTAGESFTRPAEVTAADISAFNGTWKAERFGLGGIYMDLEMLASFGLDLGEEADLLTVTIDNGSVDLLGSPETCSFVDGKLVDTAAEEGAEPDYIVLLEGDMIEVVSASIGMSFICVRAN